MKKKNVKSFFSVLLSMYGGAVMLVIKSNYGNMDSATGIFIGMSAFMITMGFAWNIGIQLRKIVE